MASFHYEIYSPQMSSETLAFLSPVVTEKVYRFHKSMAGYAPTPLISLPNLAAALGIAGLWVKDESYRFGLNAFKGLGASYAIAEDLCEKQGIPMGESAFSQLKERAKNRENKITFVTATDGNHGRGVAWAAKTFGHEAVVYLPKGSAPERLENIRALGADAQITELNYDDAVRLANRMATERGWVLVQDTAWPGYEMVPSRIMQGYTTLARETEQQLVQAGINRPTHLFLQAGVGSMAGAVGGYFASRWKENRPKTIIVEPEKADCLLRTAKANDGSLHCVVDDMDSMMAGLCCGEPCTVAWDVLKTFADAFVSCADEYAALGMRLLGRPCSQDISVVSGESGAVTAGALWAILQESRLRSLRDTLQLNANSQVLLISTEGDTDRENYQRILRDDMILPMEK